MIEGLVLPMTGDHNVSNALAAIAVARHLRHPEGGDPRGAGAASRASTAASPAWASGTASRSSTITRHHPVEIAAVLKAARQATKGRVIAVHQPHRYTRLRDLFTQFCACFNDADTVAITEVYSAGEAPIEGISRDTLVGGLVAHGHRRALALAGEDALADFVARRVPARRHAGLPRGRVDQRLGQRAARAAGREERRAGAGRGVRRAAFAAMRSARVRASLFTGDAPVGASRLLSR